MTSSPNRPWFRFHLLTAVLMMIAAGGLLGVNLSLLNDRIARDDHYTVIDCYEFGLPCPTFTLTHPAGGMACKTPNDSAYVLNLLVNGFALLGVYVLSESLLRRRETRKP